VILLAVDPLQDEFLGGIVVVEGLSQLVPALQTAVCRECEMLLTVTKPYSAEIGKLLQCFFLSHNCIVLKMNDKIYMLML